MRILCIADDFPWPEKSGYKIRLANVVRALSELGELDLFLRVPASYEGDVTVPGNAGPTRSMVSRGSPHRTSRMMLRWATSRLPRMLARADWSASRRDLASWLRPPYDLVWYGHADSYLELRALVPDAPVVVDLDNLEDQRIRHQREGRSLDRGRRDHLRAAPRAAVARTWDRLDERRWAALQRRVASSVDAVTLCSQLDAERLGCANVEVIPNGYELATPPTTVREPDPDGPVIALVGLLTYEPNADAAWYFVEDVFPQVRARLGGVRLRLIGRYDAFVEPLATVPGVELRGEVPDVAAELVDADLSLAPIRFGGGTRVKVLESFARRIPVVSTSIGYEGIEAVPGEHLLVGDTPAVFADACVRLLEDQALRVRITDAAYELWLRKYRWSDLRPRVSTLARRVAADDMAR